jgi:hypothetical protein
MMGAEDDDVAASAPRAEPAPEDVHGDGSYGGGRSTSSAVTGTVCMWVIRSGMSGISTEFPSPSVALDPLPLILANDYQESKCSAMPEMTVMKCLSLADGSSVVEIRLVASSSWRDGFYHCRKEFEESQIGRLDLYGFCFIRRGLHYNKIISRPRSPT